MTKKTIKGYVQIWSDKSWQFSERKLSKGSLAGSTAKQYPATITYELPKKTK